MAQVYRCERCGSKHDFASQADGRLCDHCAAPLAYHGQESSAWHDNPHMRDWDQVAAV